MRRPRLAIAITMFVAACTLAPTSTFAKGTDRGTVSTPRLGRTVATIDIPSISLRTQLLYGIHDDALAKGLGLWPGTAIPGKPGNSVIAGHRTSHGAPMRDIDKLNIGDRIYVTTAGKRSVVLEFRVTKRQIVRPDAMWITRPTRGSTLTIFACHPPHSIAYRYVIFAKLVPRPNTGSA